MDELTLGLIGAGAVVVAGVVAYNAWQGAKVRRRMPRPMPHDMQETPADDALEPAPFIEPAPPPARREPAFAHDKAPDGRIEPGFGNAANMPASVDGGSAARMNADTNTDTDADENMQAGDNAAPDGVRNDDVRDDNVRDGAATAAGASAEAASAAPAVIDPRIDCIVPLRLASPVASERAFALAQKLRRADNKPVYIEGQPEGATSWKLLQNEAAVRYETLRAAVQLANRSGALNELAFSEFVCGVQQFADALDAVPEFPDMVETVAKARELDNFAAQCDAQLLINVMSDGAPWSANYVQSVVSRDGLLLARDGRRFVRLDARQSPLFMLEFGDTNFLRDDLTYKGAQMIVLILDVPTADETALPFRLMCDYAKSLATRLGGQVVDEHRRPLPDAALQAVDAQLMALYAKLKEAGLTAGSPVARRLFSQ